MNRTEQDEQCRAIVKALLDSCVDLEQCAGINHTMRTHPYSCSALQLAVIAATDSIRDRLRPVWEQVR